MGRHVGQFDGAAGERWLAEHGDGGLGCVPRWYPGIKQGRLQVTNKSGEPVTVTLQAASDSSSGCWYAPSWADAPAFPTAGVTVPAGQTSAIYTMGAYTAGTDGSCAATNNTDIWRGYLVVTPVNHPADARLVRLRLNPDMTVDVENQAGGATTVSIAARPAAAGGVRVVDRDGGHAGGADAAVAAHGDRRPGHPGGDAGSGGVPLRRDRRHVPAAGPVCRPDRDAAADRAGLRRRDDLDRTGHPGAGDGADDRAAGRASSSCRSARRRSGGRTRPASPPTSTSGSAFGTGDPAVGGGDVGGPAGPGRPDQRQGPQIAATSTGGIAAPVDTGIDQAPLSVQVLDTNSKPLPISDPSYQRDLLPRRAHQHAGHQPVPRRRGREHLHRGQPVRRGVSQQRVRRWRRPVRRRSTGSTTWRPPARIDQKIIGYLATTAATPRVQQRHRGARRAIAPVEQHDVRRQRHLAGRVRRLHRRHLPARPDRHQHRTGAVTPAMYLDTTSGVQIGLLTAAQATTAVSTLPLQHANGTAEHLLASAPLTVSASGSDAQPTPRRSSRATGWTPTW